MKLGRTLAYGALMSFAVNASAIEIHQAAPIRIVEAAPMKSRAEPPEKAHILKGNALFKEGRYADAIAAYTSAIDANPGNDGAWYNRGLAYAKTGPSGLAAAHEDLSRAIELNPRNDRAFYARAFVNRNGGREQYHLQDMDMAAQLGHEKAQSYMNALAAQRPQNRPSEAAPPAPNPSGNAGGNPVEPFSNGLAMAMTPQDIKQRFGDPGRRGGFASCDMFFPDFRVSTCYGQGNRTVYLSAPGVRLNSGIGVGSSKADAARVFGNPFGGTMGPYKLDLSYAGDRVANIKIEYSAPAAGNQGASSADLARNNHYMNMQQLNNRMNQNGTIGYNPFRNQ